MSFNAIFRTALLAGLVGAAGIASAQDWDGPHHHGPGRGEFGMLQALSLTDAQTDEVHAAMQAGHQASASVRSQLHAVDDQIRARFQAAGSVTMADVAPLLRQKEQLMAQLDQQRMATRLAIRAVLTPEQISKAAAMETRLATLRAQERAVTHPTGE